MKVNFVEQGAKRYVIGKTERFDQKNEMFCRPFWDPPLLELGKLFYETEVPPKRKSGYSLKDQAMVNASWRLENAFAQGVLGGRMGLYGWEWDGKFDYPLVPPGLKVDINDPAEIAKGIKKAASFFGAARVGICELDRRWLYSAAYPLMEQRSVPNELQDEYIGDRIRTAFFLCCQHDNLF